MKRTSLILSGLLALTLCFSAFGADDLDPNKKVKDVEIGSMPAKTSYVIGEEFTMEGGTLLVTYDDGSTDEIPMDAPSVKVKEPGLKASGTKTVQLKVGKKNARFTVNVANDSFVVTYDENYEGAPEAATAEAVKGEKAEEVTPQRDGYAFQGWYVDPDFTALYDFKTPISSDLTLYALWVKDGADTVNVTFDYDYYGAALTSYSYPVEKGAAVAEPAAPEREGYAFVKWVMEDGSDADFAAAIEADTTFKASWEKTASGRQTYVFEAEDTNLTGKTGPAISGTANEIGMIMANDSVGASNGRFVGYMYQMGNTVDFYLAADEDLDDVTLSLSLSAEMEDLHLTPDAYGVSLNGVYLSYGSFDIEDVPGMNWVAFSADPAPFKTFVVAEGVSLKKGANVIKLETLNSQPYEGTTMVAHAPLADCLMVETEGVVTWDANFGEPALDNYAKD